MKIASEYYIDQLSQMHTKKAKWGATKPVRSGLKIKGFAEQTGVTSVLDYGCGHGRLVEWLRAECPGIDVMGYDPGRPEWAQLPESVDMLVSNDVMEHVEPEYLDNVIALQKQIAQRFMYHRIHLRPARKKLPDGRNCHLIQESGDWWQRQYEDDRWICRTMTDDGTIAELYLFATA